MDKLLFLLLAGTGSGISVSYSINEQIPPIARVGSLFSYTFPSNTFSDYTSTPTYSLSGCPSWLSVTSNTLSGTPVTAGLFNCSLMATDPSSGSSATDLMTLDVSSLPAPTITRSIESQLESMGKTDGNGGLILSPGQAFSLTFANDTFSVSDGISAYYGTSDNHTPLPAWISFNAASITFAGTAPTLTSSIAPPLYYQFVLLASDEYGFSAISATFNIIIGQHTLLFASTSHTIEASYGTAISYTVTPPTLDSTTISTSNISSITTNITSTDSWLSFDSSSYKLSGTPSTGDVSSTVAITVTDVYSDVATFHVYVHLASTTNTSTTSTSSSTLFTMTLPDINATIGTFFQYTISSTYLANSSVTLAATFSGSSSWLSFNSSNNTIYGQVPSSSSLSRKRATASSAGVTITASYNGVSSSESFNIQLVDANTVATVSSSQSSSTTSSVSSGSHTATVSSTTKGSSSTAAAAVAASTSSAAATTSSAAAVATASKSGLSTGAIAGIALGVTVPVLGALALLLFCCCRRRQKSGSTRSNSPPTKNISRPLQLDVEKPWPTATLPDPQDEPQQLGVFNIFKSTSEGGLSGYIAEINPTRLSATTSISAMDQRASGASINTVNTVSTDEIFSVRLVDGSHVSTYTSPPVPAHLGLGAPVFSITPPEEEPPLPRRALYSNLQTHEDSAHTIGTYTTSDGGDYIERFGGSTEENLAGHGRPDSNDSLGSYATTNSDDSNEFSLDEHEVEYGLAAPIVRGTPMPHTLTAPTLLEAPQSPRWASPRISTGAQTRPSIEQQIEDGDARMVRFPNPTRPLSVSMSASGSERSGSSGELAFV